MCGIVGAVAQRNIVPILVEGLQAPRIPRLRLLRRRGPAGRRLSARAAPRAWPSCERQVARRPPDRRHRHRPHALGHARRAGRAQRAPALLRPTERTARRPHRAGAQRHHREPRRAARRAAGQGLRLREPDRHRGHRPPGRPPVRRRPVRGRAARRPAPARRLRDRRVLPRRAAPRGRRAPGLAAGAGRRQGAARTSSPPTRWRWPA